MSESSREDRIREEAFLLWNADGRPEGKADNYWHRAEKRIDEVDERVRRQSERGEI